LFVGGDALSQVWLFIVAPIAGGILAAVVWKMLKRE
jgi:aquaporin Z